MMNDVKNVNELSHPYATLEEFGVIEHKFLKNLWKVVSKILIVLAIIMLYLPIIVIAIQSFNASDSTTEFTGFTLNNYATMFAKRSLNDSIVNTLKTSLIATAVATVVGTFIGIGAHYLSPKMKSHLMFLNNIPLLNADIVTGVSLMLIFSLFLPINKHIFGFWTILIAHIYFILPYIILSVIPKMKEIDPNMLDAALDLGIRPVKALRKVIIPAIKGGIFSGMILAFTISFEDFVVGYFTTGNGYNTLSIWIYSSIGKKSLNPAVYAFSTLVTFIMIASIVLYNFIRRKKEDE